MNFERVLIASRGELARRLIDVYREEGVETVVVFSEADGEHPYLDDADYAVYLNGRTVAETYLDPHRVVAAALDAGCDAIHPGYCFLAERVDFYQLAVNANLRVYGCDPTVVARAVDRTAVRRIAATLNLPMIPASDPIPPDEDGVATGAQLGFPLFAKAVAGGALARVEGIDALRDAVRQVRKLAKAVSGDPAVFLERAVDDQRHIGVTIVADRHGHVVHLGPMDGSLEVRYHTWVEELGPEVAPGVADRIAAASVELARALQYVGVGKVRWAVTPNGGWYLLGFSARLATGYSLTEAVHGVDLIRAQAMALEGEPIPWVQRDARLTQHGIQLRIFHVRAEDLSRPEQTLTALVPPPGVRCDVGVQPGVVCSEDSEPLILKLNVVGPTRADAVRRAREALDALVIEGIDTNLPTLRALLASPSFEAGQYDVRTLEAFRAG